HEREPWLGGEAADCETLELTFERADEPGVRVAEARHCHAGKEVEVLVAVEVDELGAVALAERQRGKLGDALDARRDEPLLGRVHRARPRPGYRQGLGVCRAIRLARLGCGDVGRRGWLNRSSDSSRASR